MTNPISIELQDWRQADGASVFSDPIAGTLSIRPERIDIEFPDGRSIWIEQEAGIIKVHGYATFADEPVNLYLAETYASADCDAPGDQFQFRRDAERAGREGGVV